jgi:hypothetical protein
VCVDVDGGVDDDEDDDDDDDGSGVGSSSVLIASEDDEDEDETSVGSRECSCSMCSSEGVTVTGLRDLLFDGLFINMSTSPSTLAGTRMSCNADFFEGLVRGLA